MLAQASSSTSSFGDASPATYSSVMHGWCGARRDATQLAPGVRIPLADEIGRQPHEVAEVHAGRLEVPPDVVDRDPELLERIVGNVAVGSHPDLTGDHEHPLRAGDLDLVRVRRERRMHGVGIARSLHRPSR